MDERKEKDLKWDVIVIGGGPAGMMAAGRAGELGARVLLLEKNPRLGEKLLITGGGRSNITNHEFNVRTFLKKFPDHAKFLFSAFAQFSVRDTLNFFHAHHMDTILEAEGRVFPATEKARTVQQTLIAYMQEGHVTIRPHAEVKELLSKDQTISGVRLSDGNVFHARSYVLATGGLSHPETGSTGDGFRFLSELGHAVNTTNAALVPVRTKEEWAHELSGLSFPEAKVTISVDGKKRSARTGKILFTHFGLSGPLILNMSKEIKETLIEGAVKLEIDLFPRIDRGTLDRTIRELFQKDQNKKLKNVLVGMIPSALTHTATILLQIDENNEVNKITKEERLRLAAFLKTITLSPTGLLGADRAIVTSGGVALEEVDTRSMCSRKYHNLYLVGDVLDIDRPSGGYSLQLCWTTGWVAGSHAAMILDSQNKKG